MNGEYINKKDHSADTDTTMVDLGVQNYTDSNVRRSVMEPILVLNHLLFR